MLPLISDAIIDFESAEEVIRPSRTYRVDFDAGMAQGHTDEIGTLKQAIFCRLMTERGLFPIYSQSYGLPFQTLVGQSVPLVYVNIANAITETLLEDDRINAVSGFIFDTDKRNITVSFQVSSIYGDLDFEEVELNV